MAYYTAFSNNKWGIIDSSGNTEIRVWYEEFKEQYATAIKNWNITEIKEAKDQDRT